MRQRSNIHETKDEYRIVQFGQDNYNFRKVTYTIENGKKCIIGFRRIVFSSENRTQLLRTPEEVRSEIDNIIEEMKLLKMAKSLPILHKQKWHQYNRRGVRPIFENDILGK